MMNLKIKILLIATVFIGIVVLVIAFGTQKEILPIGSPLPKIKLAVLNDSGFVRLNNKPVMIMYFKSDCPYCEYELNIMNRRIDELAAADVYLITIEKSFFADSLYKSMHKLINADNVKFGLVAKDEYKEKFGIMITPAFYFFDTRGKLVEKIIGETKFDRLLGSIRRSGGSKHQSGGTN